MLCFFCVCTYSSVVYLCKEVLTFGSRRCVLKLYPFLNYPANESLHIHSTLFFFVGSVNSAMSLVLGKNQVLDLLNGGLWKWCTLLSGLEQGTDVSSIIAILPGVDASNSGHYCSDTVRSTTAIKNLGVLCIKQFGTQFVVAVSRWFW